LPQAPRPIKASEGKPPINQQHDDYQPQSLSSTSCSEPYRLLIAVVTQITNNSGSKLQTRTTNCKKQLQLRKGMPLFQREISLDLVLLLST
jgi:hypothetical protein